MSLNNFYSKQIKINIDTSRNLSQDQFAKNAKQIRRRKNQRTWYELSVVSCPPVTFVREKRRLGKTKYKKIPRTQILLLILQQLRTLYSFSLSPPPSIAVPVLFKPSLFPAIFVSRGMIVSVSALFVTIPRPSLSVVVTPIPARVIPRISGVPMVTRVIVPTRSVPIIDSSLIVMRISVVTRYSSIFSGS